MQNIENNMINAIDRINLTDSVKQFNEERNNKSIKTNYSLTYDLGKNTVTKRSENKYAYFLETLANNGMIKKTKAMENNDHFASGSSLVQAVDNQGLKVKTTISFFQHNLAPFYEQARAKKSYYKIGSVLQHMDTIQDLENNIFVLLTLTYPNEIRKEHESVEEFVDKIKSRHKRAKKKVNDLQKSLSKKYYNVGMIIKSEMTYKNAKKGFNPHFHIILTFGTGVDLLEIKEFCFKYWFKNFLAKEEWDKDYKEQDFRTAFYTRKMLTNGKKTSAFEQVKDKQEIINEVAKYVAKSNDYLSHDIDVFAIFYLFTKGSKRTTFTGIFYEFAKMYENGEIELTEEEQEENERSKSEVAFYIHYEWDKSKDVFRAYKTTTPTNDIWRVENDSEITE